MLLSFVPLTIQGVVSNSQAVSGLGNLLGKLESYQRGFNWNIPFKCRRLKPWVDFSPENIRRVEKQADSYFWGGGCSGNSRGETWGLISLAIRALPHDLVTGGILMLAPGTDWLYSLQPQMEKLYTVNKNKTGSWLWLRSWTPYYQIQTEIEESRENH